MTGQKSLILVAGLVVIWGIWSAAALSPGALFVTQHEGDTLHFADITLRMAAGQVPHLDFMTPIGGMAFWPVAWAMALGLPLGLAYLAAQSAVALVLGAAMAVIAAPRLNTGLALAAVGLVLWTSLAVVHGGADPVTSLSMHYNRWAWAAAYVVVIATLLPPTEESAVREGVVLGVLLAFLAMVKVTYFVALLPAGLVALILTGRWRTLLIGGITGLIAAGAITLVLGIAFWTGYLGDLLTVAGTATRPYPSAPLSEVIGAPGFISATALAVFAVLVLSRMGAERSAIVLLLFLPGFVYITYQNFGNDPKWLPLVALAMFALSMARVPARVFGLEGHMMARAVGAGLLLLAVPSLLNLTWSPFRHALQDTRTLGPLVVAEGQDHALNARIGISYAPNRMEPLTSGFVTLDDRLSLKTPVTAYGEDWPFCEVQVGLSAYFATLADTLPPAATEGTLFAADLFNASWMFGATQPPVGQAPWYYGGLSGLDDATHVLIPSCANAPDLRNRVLSEMEEADVALTEVARHPFYVLYAKD